jgi:hypothetical protein
LTSEQVTALVAAITALIVAVTGLLGAVVKLWSVVEDNRRAINGRVDQLVATARVAGHAEGVALGQALAHNDNPPAEAG